MRPLVLLAVATLTLAGCGQVETGSRALGPAPEATPVSSPNAAGPVFLPACPGTPRLQTSLDFAGLPPLVPDTNGLKCLLAASTGGSAYDAGSEHLFQLRDGRELTLYERRGGLPAKAGAATPLRSGTREVKGETWRWSVLETGITTLSATTRGTYVELWMRGDESLVDDMARVAATLRPAATWPRLPAASLCATLTAFGNPVTVAGAFDSTAAAIARWEETPTYLGGPAVLTSDWRKAPPSEVVTMCYLDGDFGPAKQPAPPPGASLVPRPNWDRILVLVGVDRRPIPRVYGWRHSIAVTDPGR